MQLSSGDRVRLNRTGGEGRARSAPDAFGKVYVHLDSGSSCTFDVAELTRLPVEAKVWPPADLETK